MLRFIGGVVVFIFLIGVIANISKNSQSGGSDGFGTSNTNFQDDPQPTPKFDIAVTDCEVDFDSNLNFMSLTTKGYVENTGEVPVHFVRITSRWQDESGTVVDTGSSYAVGSETLRPGERSTFRDTTREASAERCLANVERWRIP